MNYRPPRKRMETLDGFARVTKAKKGNDKYFHVVITDSDGNTTDAYIKPENAPAYMDAGEWKLRISSDKTKILSAVPGNDIVVAQFHDIAHREGEEPVPYKKTFPKGGSAFKFTWIWEICEGKYKGAQPAQFLYYRFGPEKDEQGREVATYVPPTGKSTEELDEVVTAAGVWNYGPIPYEENILPQLRKRANRAKGEHDTKVRLTLVDGWVTAVKPVAVGWDEEDTDYNPEQPKEPQVSVPVEDVEEEVTEPKTEKDDGINWDDDE